MRADGVVFFLTATALTAGAARLGYLEYSRGEEFRGRARQQQTATMTIPAQRGEILDSKGRVLAGSVRRPSVFVDASMLDDPRFAAHSVAAVLGVDASRLEQEITEAASKRDYFRWVRRELSDDELAGFQRMRSERGLRAFGVEYEPRRVYPFGSMASHVMGFVSGDQRGLGGVEYAFEAALQGTPGSRSATVDVLRRRLADQPDRYVAPKDGASVVLTLDAHLQQRTEYHLRNAVEQYKAQWGAAVLMDPHSGEVLAMATMPDFDPARPMPTGPLDKKTEEAARERTRNRAISDAYEPGSIFKPFIASLALENKLARMDEVFAINGPARQFGQRTIHDTHAYGTLAFWEVISKSSNIGMGILGGRLGNEKLHRYVRLFGFGDPTGVNLAGEHTGLVQDFSRWGPFSTQSIPIGQEIAVTPIQVLTAFCVFCNDGLLMRPRVIRGVVAADGEALMDDSRPIPLRRVLSPEVTREFRKRALAETVISGTGKKAAIPDYQVFGKTGTAQVAHGSGGGYMGAAYVGSFVGGAPLGNPRVAIVVSLYRPGGREYYGGTIAAPTAGAILADALAYLNVPRESGVVRPGDGASGGD